MDVLKEIKNYHPAVFDRIVPEYSGSVHCLKLDIDREKFTDSYRGKVWIWVILLESRNVYIRGAIREEIHIETKLTPELLDQIFEYNKSSLPKEKQDDLQESLKRLKFWIPFLRSEIQ